MLYAKVWDPSCKLAAKGQALWPGRRLLGMESQGPRNLQSPHPTQAFAGPACAVKMSHWVGALKSLLEPGLGERIHFLGMHMSLLAEPEPEFMRALISGASLPGHLGSQIQGTLVKLGISHCWPMLPC